MYFCIGRMHPGGTCKGVSGAGPAIDRLVTELVLAYLSSHTIEIKEGTWEGQAALDLAEAKIEELMAAYDNDELPGTYVFPRVRKKEAEIAELRREHSEWLKANTGPTRTGVASSWPGLDLEQRRAIIETVVEAVVLKPATRQGLRAFERRSFGRCVARVEYPKPQIETQPIPVDVKFTSPTGNRTAGSLPITASEIWTQPPATWMPFTISPATMLLGGAFGCIARVTVPDHPPTFSYEGVGLTLVGYACVEAAGSPSHPVPDHAGDAGGGSVGRSGG